MEVASCVEIKQGCVLHDSRIEKGAKVGPYAHFRPESSAGENSKIGNFVELKKTQIGNDTSVAHLSYLGDAQVGNRVNIGCGFVTCNFDGRVIDGKRKHVTVIEDDVFMGSDCQTVAPVRIGKGSYVASGSTVTEEVPPESLAIARSRQVTKVGYAKKLKSEKGNQ
jgi:bifunctional UDP-N-acetylglucosamine pyrophosphorylase/glucosamine-1-phosphate N-acetyltransferase